MSQVDDRNVATLTGSQNGSQLGTSRIEPTQEITRKTRSGWGMLALTIVMLVCGLALAISLIAGAEGGAGYSALSVVGVIVGFIIAVVACLMFAGFVTIQPNQARVLVLFGSYRGTAKETGLRWVNPFYTKTKVSLRARTLNGEHLKVNDKLGNPIEIANVTVWHVDDTAKAVFDVDNYEEFVAAQSETALRHVASLYAYDHMNADDALSSEITLRSNIAEVSDVLKRELSERLCVAGVTVDDARLTHLAYAPEIAQAMLRRQQADAVISARSKIVRGAVDMVEMALNELSEKHLVDLDDERKAAMVSNLLVVLCGDSEAQPVVNAGTLYQ